MNGAFYIAATGLRSQQRALEVVANNVANINTPAFKRAEVRFAQMVGPADPAAMSSAVGGATLAGVRVDQERAVFTQGDLKRTGDPAHLAIDGDGFIELLGPAGQTLLWRGGALVVNADGLLTADNGLTLKAMVSAPLEATELSLDGDGVVRAITASGTEEVGRIDLVRVKDLSAIAPAGEGLYAVSDESLLMTARPGEDGAGRLVQGALESSNVQLSDEMVTLLLMQRAFAANAQVVQAGDQLMSIANGLKR